MKVALAQINTTIGNFPQNVKRIIDFTNRAKQQNAQIVVFPELCLCGYPPMDLLDYPAFCDANQQALSSLQKQLSSDIAVLVGYVRKHKASTGKSLQNAVSIILNGNILMTQAKSLLPTYDVFDEARYFEPGQEFQCQNIAGIRIGIAICEDIWAKSINMKYACDPITNLVDAGAEIILVPSASPFVAGKFHDRKELVKTITLEHATPVIYVNLVGGNDSLIFDGYSMAVAKKRRIMPSFFRFSGRTCCNRHKATDVPLPQKHHIYRKQVYRHRKRTYNRGSGLPAQDRVFSGTPWAFWRY